VKRAAIAAILTAGLMAGFFMAAANILTDETWPEW